MSNIIEKQINIAAPAHRVWEVLTNAESMVKWMGEPEMNLKIKTNWEVGHSISISGFHHLKFENKGLVLTFEPDRLLRYTSLSSISRLPDVPESYSTIEFRLQPHGNETSLNLTINNFPTETIYKHLNFYWQTTIVTLKRTAEKSWIGVQ